MAMSLLGSGLSAAKHDEDALSVREAELSLVRRLGAAAPEQVSVYTGLNVMSNIASSYQRLGRLDEALPLRRDVYFGYVKLHGEEHMDTFLVAENYALVLLDLQRFKEAKRLLRKTASVAQRVLGASHAVTLKMRSTYAAALHEDPAATLDDLREAVTTLEDAEPTARRVLGGAHPYVVDIENALSASRAALRARETPSTSN